MITHASQHKSAGFSLIEVLVSLALFAIVMTMAVGTLIVLVDANAKAQTVETLINGVSSSLDSMTRELRTGYNYSCGTGISVTGGLSSQARQDDAPNADCANGNALAFTESGGSLTDGFGSKRIIYALVDDSSTNGKGVIKRYLGTVAGNGGSTAGQSVTPDAVDITKFEVSIRNSDPTDNRSPNVTIYIEGTAGDIPLTDTSFSLQTTITQQQLDI